MRLRLLHSGTAQNPPLTKAIATAAVMAPATGACFAPVAHTHIGAVAATPRKEPWAGELRMSITGTETGRVTGIVYQLCPWGLGDGLAVVPAQVQEQAQVAEMMPPACLACHVAQRRLLQALGHALGLKLVDTHMTLTDTATRTRTRAGRAAEVTHGAVVAA